MNVKTPNREILKSKVAEVLTSFKEDNGITYVALAEMLDTTYLQVHRWVSKKTLPDPDRLDHICNVLGVHKSSLLGSTVFPADKLTIDDITDYYSKKSNDPGSQRKHILLAASLVCDYLASKKVKPVLLLQTGAESIWELPPDPDMHDIHAMFTCDGIDNIVLFGSSVDIKFQFLSQPSSGPILSLNADNLITAVSTQLINKELQSHNGS
jgi:transcriptional regulator with XRE-family HTH domain